MARLAVLGDFLESAAFCSGRDVIHVFDNYGHLLCRGHAYHDCVNQYFWFYVREFQWKSPGLVYVYLSGEEKVVKL